jgi:uncharacterized protein with HEPN domain
MIGPRDSLRLRHMLDASRRAVEFMEGKSREDLRADEMLALALVRLLEIIGEAAKNVENPVSQAHPEIPWKQMAGARDRLIHGYFDVDLDIIWSIIRSDLPPVIKALESILGEGSS